MLVAVSDVEVPVWRYVGAVGEVGGPVVVVEEVDRGGVTQRSPWTARDEGGGAIAVVALAGLGVLLGRVVPVLQRRGRLFVEYGPSSCSNPSAYKKRKLSLPKNLNNKYIFTEK